MKDVREKEKEGKRANGILSKAKGNNRPDPGARAGVVGVVLGYGACVGCLCGSGSRVELG